MYTKNMPSIDNAVGFCEINVLNSWSYSGGLLLYGGVISYLGVRRLPENAAVMAGSGDVCIENRVIIE
jgi:hypothetical protein